MPNNNPQQIRRPRPTGLIFSFLLIIGIVFLFVYLLLGRGNTTDVFESEQVFIDNFINCRISTIQETDNYNSFVVLSGEYNSPNGKRNYTFKVDSTFYTQNNNVEFVYHLEDDMATTHAIPAGKSLSELVHGWESTLETYNATGKSTYTGLKILNAGDAYVVSFWDQWGPTIILMIGSVIIVLFLFSRLSGAVGNSNNKALEFNKSRARKATSKVRFADVAGCDEEKYEMEELVSYLKEPKKYAKFGAKLPKGVLLVGPPGTGKTLLAKAVAGEAGVPFYSISGSDFVEMFVGVGAGRVRDMFKTAKENAPCLVFIDEIDAVGRQRGAGLGGGNDEREQTLNQLLVEMDGFSDNSGIIVIAATNRDDVLDPALLRAGRFDRKITVSLPDRLGREAIFKVHSRNKVVASDVDFAALAKRTVGFSGADIENIMNEAAILAVRKNKEQVDIDEIDEAIDRRIAGPAKSSKSLSEHERKIVAFHEAGHAIIGIKYPHSDKVQKITIVPRGNTGGHVRMTPEEDRFLLTKNELTARIVGFLGGRSSEEIFFDDISTGAQNDIEQATLIARMMVTELGMSSLGPIQYERDTGSVFLGRDYTSNQKNFSAAIAEQIDREVRGIIEQAHEEAKALIKKYKKEVTLIANTLIEHEQITAEEIDYLLENGHLKRDEEPKEEPKKEEEIVEESPTFIDTPKEETPVSDSPEVANTEDENK